MATKPSTINDMHQEPSQWYVGASATSRWKIKKDSPNTRTVEIFKIYGARSHSQEF